MLNKNFKNCKNWRESVIILDFNADNFVEFCVVILVNVVESFVP